MDMFVIYYALIAPLFIGQVTEIPELILGAFASLIVAAGYHIYRAFKNK